MAEGSGLLNRRTGITGTEGSNPSLSAISKSFTLRVVPALSTRPFPMTSDNNFDACMSAFAGALGQALSDPDALVEAVGDLVKTVAAWR